MRPQPPRLQRRSALRVPFRPEAATIHWYAPYTMHTIWASCMHWQSHCQQIDHRPCSQEARRGTGQAAPTSP